MLTVLIAIPDFVSGTGRYAISLRQGLRSYFPDKFNVKFFIFEKKGIPGWDTMPDDVYSIDSPLQGGIRRALKIFSHARAFSRAVDSLKPDIILSVGTYMNILCSIARTGVPLILTEHDVPSIRLKYSRQGFIIRWFMKLLYPSKSIVGTSGGVVEDLRSNYSCHDIRLIYHGIDTEELRDKAREACEIKLTRPYVLSIGRLTVQKDYATLLRAYAIALTKGVKEDLVILGEGEERERLQSLARELGIEQHVRMPGHVDNPYPYLATARMFVLSSIWEGFGYVIIEALTLGIPTVSTDCLSGPSEILGHGKYGILITPGDSKELGNAMHEILTDPVLHRRYALRAKERIREFSIKNMADKYANMINDITHGKKQNI